MSQRTEGEVAYCKEDNFEEAGEESESKSEALLEVPLLLDALNEPSGCQQFASVSRVID